MQDAMRFILGSDRLFARECASMLKAIAAGIILTVERFWRMFALASAAIIFMGLCCGSEDIRYFADIHTICTMGAVASMTVGCLILVADSMRNVSNGDVRPPVLYQIFAASLFWFCSEANAMRLVALLAASFAMSALRFLFVSCNILGEIQDFLPLEVFFDEENKD